MELLGVTIADWGVLIGLIIAILELRATRKDIKKKTAVDEANFIRGLFNDFQHGRQAMLDNPKSLKILADGWESSEEELIQNSIGSFWINQAFLLYYLNKKNHLSGELWLQNKRDIKRLFSDDIVIARWNNIHELYSEDFQRFIDSYILHEL